MLWYWTFTSWCSNRTLLYSVQLKLNFFAREDCRGWEELADSWLKKNKSIFCLYLTAIHMLLPPELTQCGCTFVRVYKQTHICPFYTSESHVKWPCVSVWDRESRHCLPCWANDPIAANLLTELLCRELPEETAPLHMNLSVGQLDRARGVWWQWCVYTVDVFVCGKVKFSMIASVLAMLCGWLSTSAVAVRAR